LSRKYVRAPLALNAVMVKDVVIDRDGLPDGHHELDSLGSHNHPVLSAED
jgi:hypothetical protein